MDTYLDPWYPEYRIAIHSKNRYRTSLEVWYKEELTCIYEMIYDELFKFRTEKYSHLYLLRKADDYLRKERIRELDEHDYLFNIECNSLGNTKIYLSCYQLDTNKPIFYSNVIQDQIAISYMPKSVARIFELIVAE